MAKFAVMIYEDVRDSQYDPLYRWTTGLVCDTEEEATEESIKMMANLYPARGRKVTVVEYHSKEWERYVQ